jgi:protein gp37
MATAIEWTDETWNPVVGCSEVSPGCDHCYAVGVAHRAMQPAHEGLTIRTDSGVKWNGTVRCLPERLSDPLSWTKPRRVFVNSMSDLFHPDVPEQFIADVFDVMACHGPISRHTFQVLTKRPQRMAQVLNQWAEVDGYRGAPNVWLGTSIESSRYAFRADHLRATPAAVRFLSVEPLLGPLAFKRIDLLSVLAGMDWVIVGGESGPKARPMHPMWVRDIRDACEFLEIPFFFKQWGSWAPTDLRVAPIARVVGSTPEDGRVVVDRVPGYGPLRIVEPEWACGLWHPENVVMERTKKKIAGRELDGRTWDEYPKAVA